MRYRYWLLAEFETDLPREMVESILHDTTKDIGLEGILSRAVDAVVVVRLPTAEDFAESQR